MFGDELRADDAGADGFDEEGAGGAGDNRDSWARAGRFAIAEELTFQAASAKFARLTGVAGEFEFEVEASGSTHSKIWEWK